MKCYIYQNIYIITKLHPITLDLQYYFNWYIGSCEYHGSTLTNEILFSSKAFRPNQHSKDRPAFQCIFELNLPNSDELTSYEEELMCWVKDTKVPQLIADNPNLSGLIKVSNKICASTSRLPVNFDFDKESKNLLTDRHESLDEFFHTVYNQCYGDIDYSDLAIEFITKVADTSANPPQHSHEYQY